MPTYVLLGNWTEQGMKNVRETVDWAARTDELAQKYGARFERLYWTVGPYDVVAIIDAPTTRAPRPTSGSWAHWATSGRRRFAPTTAKGCRGSFKDWAEYHLATVGRGPHAGLRPFLFLPLFTEVPANCSPKLALLAPQHVP